MIFLILVIAAWFAVVQFNKSAVYHNDEWLRINSDPQYYKENPRIFVQNRCTTIRKSKQG